MPTFTIIIIFCAFNSLSFIYGAIHSFIYLFILNFWHSRPSILLFLHLFSIFPPFDFYSQSPGRHGNYSKGCSGPHRERERERERERLHTTTLPERPWLITFYENGVKSFLGVDSSLGGSLYPACHIENMRKYLHKIWNMDLIKIY